MRLLTKLVYKYIPPIIIGYEIDGTLFNLSIRDHLIWILRKGPLERPPFSSGKLVWDLGCNIGVQSVQAAKKGNIVLAFDISPTNVLCLRKTAKENNLNIKVSCCPITIKEENWTPAKTGHLEEELTLNGILKSKTFHEPPIPHFIKMDIEGGEKEFLLSNEFKKWVDENKVTLYVEIHKNNNKFLWKEFKKIIDTEPQFIYIPK
jgi:FkbM family methyltransferase